MHLNGKMMTILRNMFIRLKRKAPCGENASTKAIVTTILFKHWLTPDTSWLTPGPKVFREFTQFTT